MSLFGGFDDFDEDVIFGNHMRSMNQHMNQMNRLMGSMMGGFGMGTMGGMGGMMDPFGMMPALGSPFDQPGNSNALMRRNNRAPAIMGLPGMNLEGLFNMDGAGGSSFCQTSITTMRTGPDGRPQVYQETSSVKGGPGGVKETRKTVQDSTRGIKKMAIGHHIGERAHIIEKEQDTRSGQMEERQDFINLDEDEAEDFDKEFQTKVRSNGRYNNDGYQMARITEVGEDYPSSSQGLRALPAPPSSSSSSSQAAVSVHPHPYNSSAARKNHRSKHSKNRNHDVQIVELPNDD